MMPVHNRVMEQNQREHAEIRRHQDEAHYARQQYDEAMIAGNAAATRGDLEAARRYAAQAKKYAADYQAAREAQRQAEDSLG